jgi:hypothetical protein
MHRLSSLIAPLESRIVPTTFTVTSLADSGSGTLRAALAAADTTPGKDTIVFKLPAPPTHSENVITLASTLTSKGNVTIKGPGAGKLIVSGNNTVQVFRITDNNSATDNPTTVSGLSIVSGNAGGGDGGGIYSTESLSLTGVVLSGNTAIAGGAVGVLGEFGAKTVAISNSQVFDNSATNFAGGLDLEVLTSVKLSKSTISGNTATNDGGGGYASLNAAGTGMSISGCTITDNSARYGGGLNLEDFSTVVTAKSTVSGCTISDNASTGTGTQGGGGLYLRGGNFAVSGCTISNNTAVYFGGGAEATHFDSLTITKSTVTGNQTTRTNAINQGGGGLFIEGTGTAPLRPATISGCTISNNASAQYGGGTFVTGGLMLTVTGSTFAVDRAAAGGGGLRTIGTGADQVAVSITRCQFANDNGGAAGGGLMVDGDGTASVVSTKVIGCTASEGGGILAGAHAATNGFLMSGCTVSGNTGTLGGGLLLASTPDFHISASSITDNGAAEGGGVLVEFSNGSILGTKISGSAASDDAGGIANLGGGTVTLQVAKVHGNTAPTNPDLDGTFTFV